MVSFDRLLIAGVGSLFASHFLAYGLYLPFLPLVLESRGISSEEIGFILGLSLVARILAGPIMTNLSDRGGRRRRSIFFYSVLASLVPVTLFYLQGYWAAAVCVIVLTILWAPIVPLCDAYAIDAVKKANANYGRMRLWGSLAFVAANIGGGVLVAEGNPDRILLWIAFVTLLTGLVALGLPSMAGARSPSGEEENSGEKASVFRQRWFWGFICVAGLLQGVHAAFYGFSSLYWSASGISSQSIGILWSIGVVAEVVLFLFAKQLDANIRPLTYLVLAAGAGVLRWSLFPFAEGFAAIAALQVLHGLTFGAAHLGCILILGRIVPSKWAATGQGMMGTSAGLLTAIGMTVSGPLYALSPSYAFWLMAAGSVVALVSLLIMQPLLQERINESPQTEA